MKVPLKNYVVPFQSNISMSNCSFYVHKNGEPLVPLQQSVQNCTGDNIWYLINLFAKKWCKIHLT